MSEEVEALKAELAKVKLERSAYRDLINDIAKAEICHSKLKDKVNEDGHDDSWCYLPWWASDRVQQIAKEGDGMADMYTEMQKQSHECYMAVQGIEFEAGVYSGGTLKQRLDTALTKLRTLGKVDEITPLLRLASCFLKYGRTENEGTLDAEGQEALAKIEAYLGKPEMKFDK